MISLAPRISVPPNFADDIVQSGKFSEGRYVSLLESKICHIIGVKHAIATSSGSSADLVCALAMKHLYPEKDEVILPAMTFIAHANAVIMAGLKPVYVDCYPETMQMRLDFIEAMVNEKTLCIFGVHLLGKFSSVFAFDFGVPMIEDACEGFCGAFGNRKYGTLGLAGTFSFYPSHIVGCGEGGMIVTNDDEFAKICRIVKNHGRLPGSTLDKFKFPIQGTNAKMPELSAAVAAHSIDDAQGAVAKRIDNCWSLSEKLNRDWMAESPHAYPIFCENKEQRDGAVLHLTNLGIECRCMFECIPTDSWCKTHERGAFPHSEIIADNVFYVPVHQDLSKADLETISNGIKEALDS